MSYGEERRKNNETFGTQYNRGGYHGNRGGYHGNRGGYRGYNRGGGYRGGRYNGGWRRNNYYQDRGDYYQVRTLN